MEAENAVEKRLEELGYTVFYRNLIFNYAHQSVCEFDIVLRDCIVEVKSGKNVFPIGGGFNNIVMGGYLPKGFTYYVYCTAKSDDEIIEINDELNRQDIIYINRLEDIAIKNPPDNKECIIESLSKIMQVMHCKLDYLMKFNKFYITQDTYDKVYHQYNFTRDTYSLEENIMWSGKLRQLVTSGRIAICNEDDFPKTAVRIDKMPLHTRKERGSRRTDGTMKAHGGRYISIPIFHILSEMPRSRDSEDLYICAYNMRTGEELKDPEQSNY
jgi:hypothetical protein